MKNYWWPWFSWQPLTLKVCNFANFNSYKYVYIRVVNWEITKVWFNKFMSLILTGNYGEYTLLILWLLTFWDHRHVLWWILTYTVEIFISFHFQNLKFVHCSKMCRYRSTFNSHVQGIDSSKPHCSLYLYVCFPI